MNDVEDAVPGKAPANLTISQIAGNHVIIDLGFGRYAEYDHLVPHGATVKVGDYVRQVRRLDCWAIRETVTRPSLLPTDGPALEFRWFSPVVRVRQHAAAEAHHPESGRARRTDAGSRPGADR